jgi:hypothetical protein
VIVVSLQDDVAGFLIPLSFAEVSKLANLDPPDLSRSDLISTMLKRSPWN